MKVTVTEAEGSRDDLQVKIAEADRGRGKWSLARRLDYGYELRGFGGENCLYLFIIGWQSGHYHVTVVHCIVDSRTKVASLLASPANLESDLNTLIVEVGIND